MEQKNALGRRKSAVARVYLSPGAGNITINDRPLEDYFKSGSLQYIELTFSLGDGERLVHDVLKGALLEIILKGAVIDRDVAFPGREINTSDG